MAQPEFISGVGPFQANTDEPYRVASAGSLGDVGITVVTIGATKYFEWDGTPVSAEYRVTQFGRSLISADKTFRWGCVKRFRIQGVFGSVGDEVEVFRIGDSLRMRFFLVCTTDTSHYKWRVKEGTGGGNTIGTGSTEFAVGLTFFHDIRVETDGTTVTLEVNGAQEFAATNGTEIQGSAIALFVSVNLQNGQTVNVHNIQICQSNTGTDRPDPDGMTGGILTLTGDKVSSEYGGNPADCAGGTGTYTNWNDWETGDADDGTTLNCELGGEAGREVSAMSDPTTTDLYGVQVWSRAIASVAGKTVAWNIILEDTAGNIRSLAQDNLAADSWQNSGSGGFGNGPNITGWTEAVLHDSGVGVRSPDTNEANDKHTAIMVEWFGIGAAPAVTAERPVAHSGALGSANVGIY